jgi:hypothetical protein
MDTALLITSLLALASAIIGGFVSFYFTSRSKKYEAILKFREEKYSNMLNLLQGFIGNTANYETKKRFFEEQYKSWVYSSDEVVLAINNLIKFVIDSKGKEPDHDAGKKAVGDIVIAMRKDLLGKTKLKYIDFRYTDVFK